MPEEVKVRSPEDGRMGDANAVRYGRHSVLQEKVGVNLKESDYNVMYEIWGISSIG